MSRGRVRRSLAPIILSLVTVLTTAVPQASAASGQVAPPAVTKAQAAATRGPDMSQSVVQRRKARKFHPMEDVERGTVAKGEKAPRAAVPPMITEGQSEFTKTVDNGDGSFSATLSTEPVNWKDANGSWQGFDDTLVAATDEDKGKGIGAVNRSGPFKVRLATSDKARADGQLLSLTAGDAEVGVFLPGAQPSSAEIGKKGKDVTYVDAAAGADIRYRMDGPSLKEEIILKAPPAADAAPLSFAFELALSGLSAIQQEDGSIALSDAKGKPVFVIPASFMLDSSEKDTTERHSPVATSLEQLAPERVRITLAPDAAWLADPARVYPVVIDPTFHYGNGRADTSTSTTVQIDQTTPTTNYSGVTPVTVGKTAGGSGKEVLATFPSLDVVPTDATVVNALLNFTVSSGTAGMGIEIRRVTSSWAASTVTWNTAPTHVSNKSFTTAIGANSVNLTQLVYQWVRGANPNYGVRVRTTGANGQTIVIPGSGTGSLSLTVTYIRQLRLGIDDLYTYEGHDFGGGTSAQVELSTGNMVLAHADSSIPAKGFRVDLAHVYNSRDPYGQKKANPDSWAVYGEGWSFSQDQRLFEIQSGNAVIWKDGTGRIRIYTQLSVVANIRTYTNPIQYGWTLKKDMTGANYFWTLTANAGGEVLSFDSGGKLTKRADRNGNDLDYAYDGSGRLTTITDAASRTTTFSYASGSGSPTRLYEITDMAGRVTRFAYSSYGNLTSIIDAYGTADARTTTFEYYAGDQMVAVTNPNGNRSKTDYSIQYSFEGSTSSFAMAAGSTGTLTSSTSQAYMGTSSLKMELGTTGVPLSDEVVKTFSPARVWNSAPQELIAFVYVASGAPAINLTLRASQACSGGSQTATAALTAGGWNEVHLESVDVEPSCPLAELGFKFVSASSYTTPMYLDHIYFKGVTFDFTDATLGNAIVQKFSYVFDPAATGSPPPCDPTPLVPPCTVVVHLDPDGITYWATVYQYRDIGQVDHVADPLSNVTTYSFDADWRVTTFDPPGSAASSTTLTYPAGRMEWSTSTAGGLTARQGVDAVTGDMRYEIDPVNEALRATGTSAFQATIYNRDAAGNVASQKLNWYAAGANLDSVPFPTATSTVSTTSYTYTADGQVATTTDPNGVVSTDTYDTRGNNTV